MVLNNTRSLIILSALFAFSSCKKSDTVPGVPPASPTPPAPPVPVMTITSISPVSGRSSTLDTIVGTNFSAKDSVYFNGKSASIVSSSATQLVVKVPPQAGTGKITVRDSIASATGPVFTFTGNTYLVSTFAGSGNVGSANGTGTAASFYEPRGIAIDQQDNLYVAEASNNKIRKITPAGAVTTFAGSGAVGAVDGTGSAASFQHPYAIAADNNDNLYVADNYNSAIRKITPAGEVSTFVSASSHDATGAAIGVFSPYGVALDESGNVFVADRAGHVIRKVSPSGVVSTFAGSGAEGSADGKGTAASFNILHGINFDAAGNLYVTDGGNNNIRKITPDGTVNTLAGKAGTTGQADGAGTSASFSNPFDIVVDGNGFIYVADASNQVIRQITPEGAVTLLAGTIGSPGTADGPGLKAMFNSPVSVAIDSHGNIFVSDANGNTIRKLTPQ